MRTGISFIVTPAVRRHLKAVARNRNSPQKHVWRAKIILLSADGVGTNEIMRETGTSKTCVWRWQERFKEEGVDGLLRDKTRPSRTVREGTLSQLRRAQSCLATKTVIFGWRIGPPTIRNLASIPLRWLNSKMASAWVRKRAAMTAGTSMPISMTARPSS